MPDRPDAMGRAPSTACCGLDAYGSGDAGGKPILSRWGVRTALAVWVGDGVTRSAGMARGVREVWGSSPGSQAVVAENPGKHVAVAEDIGLWTDAYLVP